MLDDEEDTLLMSSLSPEDVVTSRAWGHKSYEAPVTKTCNFLQE